MGSVLLAARRGAAPVESTSRRDFGVRLIPLTSSWCHLIAQFRFGAMGSTDSFLFWKVLELPGSMLLGFIY